MGGSCDLISQSLTIGMAPNHQVTTSVPETNRNPWRRLAAEIDRCRDNARYCLLPINLAEMDGGGEKVAPNLRLAMEPGEVEAGEVDMCLPPSISISISFSGLFFDLPSKDYSIRGATNREASRKMVQHGSGQQSQ